jgi:hypothetical protein
VNKFRNNNNNNIDTEFTSLEGLGEEFSLHETKNALKEITKFAEINKNDERKHG